MVRFTDISMYLGICVILAFSPALSFHVPQLGKWSYGNRIVDGKLIQQTNTYKFNEPHMIFELNHSTYLNNEKTNEVTDFGSLETNYATTGSINSDEFVESEEEYDIFLDYDSRKVKNAPKPIPNSLFRCTGSHLVLKEIQPKGSSSVLYQVCFDTITLRAKYASFRPVAEVNNKCGNRGSWKFSGVWNGGEVAAIEDGYSETGQESNFDNAGYNIENEPKYPYFNRGHLVANADFSDCTDRKETFDYFNAAPQWKAFNKGSWSVIEETARTMTKNDPANWEVYTGTYGIIETVSNITNMNVEMNLTMAKDNNNNDKAILPLPMIFWKVIYDTKTHGNSKVYVGINNPKITQLKNHLAYHLCTFTSHKGNAQVGFYYECPLEEFLTNLDKVEDIVDPKHTTPAPTPTVPLRQTSPYVPSSTESISTEP